MGPSPLLLWLACGLGAVAVGVLFDGVNPQAGPIQPKIDITISGQADGYHEVSLRFASDDPLNMRSDTVIPIWIGEPDTVSLSLPNVASPAADASGSQPPPAVSLRDEKLLVEVSAKQAERVTLWHDAEQLAVASGTQGSFTIPLSELGLGPVRLQARAESADRKIIHSKPLWLDVLP